MTYKDLPGLRALLAGLALLAGHALLAGAAYTSQNSPRVAMLEQAGWAAIERNDPAAAAPAFREAIALDPKNPSVRFGAGLAAFLQRHDAEAKGHLEQTLQLDQSHHRARLLLARIARRQNDFTEAIRLMEMVAGALPADAPIAATLARWKRERDLHDQMRLEVGDFFTVSFEGPDDAVLAARALESLERAYWRIGDTLGVFPPKSVPVVLYTREQFRDITRSPQWAAAAFDGIIRVPIRDADEKGEDLDRVLAHEFAHALIRSLATRNLPTWLNEGLATALEAEDLSWALATVATVDAMPPLSRLAGSFGQLSGGAAQLAYATSAIAARRLLDEAGGAAVTNLLRDLGSGVEFESAFLHRIHRSFVDFQAAIRP